MPESRYCWHRRSFPAQASVTYLFHLAASQECDNLREQKKDIANALIPYLNNGEERKNVLMILGEIGPDAKAAVPSIRRFIKRSADDRLALAAQYALRGIGTNADAAVPDLIASFPPFFFGRFDNIEYRRALPRTLVAIAPNDPKVRKLLRNGLKDEEAEVRVNSAWSLWQLGARSNELKEIWSTTQKDNDPYNRKHVGVLMAWLARESPELLPLALSALKDADRNVRFHTLSMLVAGNFTQKKVMDAYVAHLTDVDEYVRLGACEGLGKMRSKGESSIPQLKKALQDKELSVRVWAARALFAIDSSTARSIVDVLIEGLTHSSNHVRAYAIGGLQELGPIGRPAIPALRRALRDEWSDVRKQAAEAIHAIEQTSR